MNVVLDTNCLLMSLSRRSQYYTIWRSLVRGEYVLCYSNEILTEYEEILTQKMGPRIASNIISAILNLPKTLQVQVFFNLRLIEQYPYDHKFVTQDHHYDILRTISFPKINVIDIDDFLKELRE